MTLGVALDPAIVQENHYDPWGWNLVGIETEGDTEHQWQFIDREKLEELGLNWYDLKARGYESVLGRFHSVDPKPDAEDQERLSTYHYSANNPILLSDPNGDCPKCWWESIKNWINAPISPLAQETGKAYMQSMTGRDIKPTTQGQFILAAIGYGSQRFAGSVPGSYKIRIPKNSTPLKMVKAPNVVNENSSSINKRASQLGDLTSNEINSIQNVVNEAGRPIEVVGSAAQGKRRGVGTTLPIGKGDGTKSDIDYLTPPSHMPYFEGLESKLPALDQKTGIIPGTHNPYMGPAIRFEPDTKPQLIPKKTD